MWCESSRRRNWYYLDENSAISVGVGIDSPSGSLTAYVAGEGNAHPPTWRFREKGPREGRYPLSTTGPVLGSDWARRTFHARPRRPPFHRRRTQNQSHRRILQIHPKNQFLFFVLKFKKKKLNRNLKRQNPTATRKEQKKSIPWRAWVCCRAGRCLIHWGRIGNPNCFHYLIRSRRQPPYKDKSRNFKEGLRGVIMFGRKLLTFWRWWEPKEPLRVGSLWGEDWERRSRRWKDGCSGTYGFHGSRWQQMMPMLSWVSGLCSVFKICQRPKLQSPTRPQNLHHISSYTHARRQINNIFVKWIIL